MRASLAILAIGLSGIWGACAVEPTEDVESLVDEICCGMNCCLIDAVCVAVGETNPANECEVCDRSAGGSPTSWTAVPDCTPSDAGAPEEDAGADEDAGMPMMDSGPMDDAGAPEEDAGGDPDAGADDDAGADEDAGGGTDAGDGGGGGGGCSVASGSQNVWLLAIGIVALVLRRRRLL